MQYFSTKDFDYNKETNTFVQEASMLPESFYPGKSFKLISHKTGKAIEFSFWKTDGHEDVAGWWYRVQEISGTKEEVAKLIDIKVLIIND